MLVVEPKGEIEVVTLNNPAKYNAFNAAALSEFNAYFAGLRKRPEVRVVILKANGKAFSTGLDVAEVMELATNNQGDANLIWEVQRNWSDTVRNMRRAPQPIICCVQGMALGGGFAISLGADIRLCTPQAKFNVQMIKLGLTGCDIGISYHLPRAVGPSAAAEMMLTGRMVSGTRAERIGLVSEVCESAEAMAVMASELADEMLATNPLGLRLTKQGLHLNADAASLEAALALEDRQQSLLAVAPSGMMAGLKGSATANKAKSKL